MDLDSGFCIASDSNFLTLGGHSVRQLLLASPLTTYFKRKIPFKTIVESATLRDLAKAIEDLEPLDVPGSWVVSF